MESFNNSSKTKNLKAVRLSAKYAMVLKALQQVNFNKTKAAIMLKIDRKTIYNIMQQHELLNT